MADTDFERDFERSMLGRAWYAVRHALSRQAAAEHAAQTGDAGKLRTLMAKGLSGSALSRIGMAAVEGGHSPALDVVLSDPQFRQVKGGDAAADFAAQQRDHEMLEALLHSGTVSREGAIMAASTATVKMDEQSLRLIHDYTGITADELIDFSTDGTGTEMDWAHRTLAALPPPGKMGGGTSLLRTGAEDMVRAFHKDMARQRELQKSRKSDIKISGALVIFLGSVCVTFPSLIPFVLPSLTGMSVMFYAQKRVYNKKEKSLQNKTDDQNELPKLNPSQEGGQQSRKFMIDGAEEWIEMQKDSASGLWNVSRHVEKIYREGFQRSGSFLVAKNLSYFDAFSRCLEEEEELSYRSGAATLGAFRSKAMGPDEAPLDGYDVHYYVAELTSEKENTWAIRRISCRNYSFDEELNRSSDAVSALVQCNLSLCEALDFCAVQEQIARKSGDVQEDWYADQTIPHYRDFASRKGYIFDVDGFVHRAEGDQSLPQERKALSSGEASVSSLDEFLRRAGIKEDYTVNMDGRRFANELVSLQQKLVEAGMNEEQARAGVNLIMERSSSKDVENMTFPPASSGPRKSGPRR